MTTTLTDALEALPGLEGNQLPRLRLVPEANTCWDHGDDALFLAAGYGLEPDPWQALVVRDWLGTREDGRWAASRCGVAVPRQNGKNSILEIVELYLMVELGYKILHTAHEVKTARKAFKRILGFFENERDYPELAAMIDWANEGIRKTNGQEAIYLDNGGSIEFIARTRSSGRGFTVDILIMDEAQELSDESLAALLPTISAGPMGNPLQIYTGTPPSPTMVADVWVRVRMSGARSCDPDDPFHDKRLAWHEWSIEAKVDEEGNQIPPDLDLREHWEMANPALDIRIDEETIEGERGAMDDATFARERLGMWDPEGQLRAISAVLWENAKVLQPPTTGKVTYGVDMNPERNWITITVCRRDGNQMHIEVPPDGSRAIESGTAWVIDWLCDPKRIRNLVVIDAKSPAAAMIPNLLQRRKKTSVIETNVDGYTRACGLFLDLLAANKRKTDLGDLRLTHWDQNVLNSASKIVTKRKIGMEGGWGWNRIDKTGDITPIVAGTLAVYGHLMNIKATRRAPKKLR